MLARSPLPGPVSPSPTAAPKMNSAMKASNIAGACAPTQPSAPCRSAMVCGRCIENSLTDTRGQHLDAEIEDAGQQPGHDDDLTREEPAVGCRRHRLRRS